MEALSKAVQVSSTCAIVASAAVDRTGGQLGLVGSCVVVLRVVEVVRCWSWVQKPVEVKL
jgi:hypothetical protein